MDRMAGTPDWLLPSAPTKTSIATKRCAFISATNVPRSKNTYAKWHNASIVRPHPYQDQLELQGVQHKHPSADLSHSQRLAGPLTMSQPSALPVFYWVIFGIYEPLLTTLGSIGGLLYPKQVHDQQAPWPKGIPPQEPLSMATQVTMMQLAHVVGLLGLINFFVLWAARRYLFGQPAIQEKIVGALLTPLLLGDILHMAITLWALGEGRWDVRYWSGTLWVTIVSGITLIVPRAAWYFGIGRYMHSRDGSDGLQAKKL